MPPLSTSLLDTQAIALVSAWITDDLPGNQTFPEWQVAHFGATNAPNAGRNDDVDSDGATNFLEWLAGTDPNASASYWSIGANANAHTIQVLVPQIANRGFEVQRSMNLSAPWQPLDVPANRPFFSATNRLLVVEQPTTNASGFYRVRVYEP
jgi:hypothetical protein